MKMRCFQCAVFAAVLLCAVVELTRAYRTSKDEMVTLTYRGRQSLSGQLR